MGKKFSKGKNTGKPKPKPDPYQAALDANVPTAYEGFVNKDMADLHEFIYGKGPKDITTLKGLNLDPYRLAGQNADAKRFGNPGMALSGGGSGDYANQLQTQAKENRYNQIAGETSRQYQKFVDDTYDRGAQGAEFQTNRTGAFADRSAREKARRDAKVPAWQRFAQLALGGASAYFNRPRGNG